jgi:hypothetical protein
MAKTTTESQCTGAGDPVLCRTGIDHAAVGILARVMQSMAVRGFIEHDHESGAYVLTDSGRAALAAILERAGIEVAPK